jgi:peroxiredoxin
VTAIALVLAAAWLGCQRETGVDQTKKPKKKPPVVTPKDEIVPPDEKPPEGTAKGKGPGPRVKPPGSPALPRVPKVVLNEQYLKASLVKVDDPMPEGELPDAEGKKHALRSLRGQKATVLLFWTGENPYSTQALADLEPDIVGRYGTRGIQVIGINHRQTAEDVRSAVQEASAKYPILLDTDGAFFAKVATEKLPRLYLLDAQGKVLWFDVEYSETTRRQLATAIEAVLAEK